MNISPLPGACVKVSADGTLEFSGWKVTGYVSSDGPDDTGRLILKWLSSTYEAAKVPEQVYYVPEHVYCPQCDTWEPRADSCLTLKGKGAAEGALTTWEGSVEIDDIVLTLRNAHDWVFDGAATKLMEDAADEIERLRARVEELELENVAYAHDAKYPR